jgi:hypothetical protein
MYLFWKRPRDAGPFSNRRNDIEIDSSREFGHALDKPISGKLPL